VLLRIAGCGHRDTPGMCDITPALRQSHDLSDVLPVEPFTLNSILVHCILACFEWTRVTGTTLGTWVCLQAVRLLPRNIYVSI